MLAYQFYDESKVMATQQTVVRSSGGVGFFGLLTVAFIVLKLTGVIAWSWLWVLSPIWIPWAVFLFCGLIVMVVIGIIGIFEGMDKRKRRKARKALDRYGKSVVR